jgi:hypothetical protein
MASDYISREGSTRSQMMMSLHLAQCKDCRTYVRGLKVTRSLISESLREPVSDELLEALGLKNPDRDGSFKEPNE